MLKALRLDILVNNAGIGRNAPLHVPDAGLGQLNGAFGAALLGVRRVQKLLADGKPIPPTAAAQPLPEGFAARRRWSKRPRRDVARALRRAGELPHSRRRRVQGSRPGDRCLAGWPEWLRHSLARAGACR